jgi:hypothetical protein
VLLVTYFVVAHHLEIPPVVTRFELPSIKEGSDIGAHAALSSGLYDKPAVSEAPALTVPASIYPEAPVATASPMAFAGADWSAVKPQLDSATAINYSTASENAAAGVEPDYILGTDGQIRPNPKKTAPNPDGSINIQMEGNGQQSNQDKIEALKSASENQKASIRELIRYFQKNNPNASIPTEWLWQLDKQPDLPTPSSSRPDTPAPRSQPQPEAQPQQDFSPRRSSAPSSPGGYRGPGGGMSPGASPRGGDSTPSYSDRPARQPMFRTGRADVPPPVAGDLELKGPPTITPEKIDQVLQSFNSPASGLGQVIYDEGVKRGINPAVALAFFIQESSAGTKGVAAETNSWGNIKGDGPAGSYKGFRAYNNFEEGVKDWYRLIDDKYLAPQSEGGRGYTTLSQVIRTYAPASDNNDERGYVANVKGMVEGWAKDSKPAVA